MVQTNLYGPLELGQIGFVKENLVQLLWSSSDSGEKKLQIQYI